MFLTQVKLPMLIARWQSISRRLKYRSTKTFFLLFALGFSLNLILSACAGSKLANYVAIPQFSIGLDKEKVVRIGHQKFGALSLVKARGELEKQLKPLGITVRWNQFPAGPQLLEGLNAGRLDFGHTGETPPISAQAAGAPLLYVASEPPNPQGEAILVQKDSPIQTIADLKGKKIALNKGSNVHYLLVKTLEKAGLSYSDIKPVFMPPADARAAFERKNIDAWAIWDPYFAAAQQATGARILADGRNIVANREFFLASQSFAKKYPDRLEIMLKAINEVDKWAQPRPSEVANILSPLIGIQAQILEQAEKRKVYGVQPITEEVVAYQQQLADTFYGLKLIRKKIDIKQVAKLAKNQPLAQKGASQ
jgi:sulfonate transport system substrate-binding protein